MHPYLRPVCLIVAIILFILAALGLDGRLQPAGLAFFAAAFLV